MGCTVLGHKNEKKNGRNTVSRTLTWRPEPFVAVGALGADPDEGAASGPPLRLQPAPEESGRRFGDAVGQLVADAGAGLCASQMGRLVKIMYNEVFHSQS